MNRVRTQFEDWCRDNSQFGDWSRVPNGPYQKPFVEHAWQAWRAAREATLEEVLRGLRSENDSTQLRAILASVEALPK